LGRLGKFFAKQRTDWNTRLCRKDRRETHMFDIPKLMQVLSEILSDKYGCTIIMTAIPKDQAECKSDLA
jgi:fructosamine-3-kinase